MAVLIKGFRYFEQPETPVELLENAKHNELIPWWRRGGMGLFEHGAILTELVPAIVLQYLLLYRDASFLLSAAAAGLSIAAFSHGIRTGDCAIIASILLPLYYLALGVGVLLPSPLIATLLASVSAPPV